MHALGRAAAVLESGTLPVEQRSAAVKALVEESGADSAILSALLAGSSRPSAAAIAASGEEVPEASSANSDVKGTSALSSGGKRLSDDLVEDLLIAESAMAMSFKLLKDADSPESIRASALALMESAGRTGELAMLSAAEGSGGKAAEEQAFKDCAQALKSSYEKLQAAASSESETASAKSSEDRLTDAEVQEWENSASERITRNPEFMSSWSSLRDMRSQLRNKKETLEKEISEMRAALQRQQETEERMEAEFAALMRVETPHDKLVSQLVGLYLLSGMVGVNVSFVASGGSLAMSTLTSLLVRCLPQAVIYVAKLMRKPAV